MCQELQKCLQPGLYQASQTPEFQDVCGHLSYYVYCCLHQVLQGTQGPLAAMEKLEMLDYQVLLGPQADQEKLVQVLVYHMLQWISHIRLIAV